jgi:hypothetical protein
MKRARIGLLTAVMASAIAAPFVFAQTSPQSSPPQSASDHDAKASPIYGVTIPEGYRQWQLIAPATEGAPLNEIRAVLGNDIAIKAYQEGTLPFPDGTILTKLAWKHVQSPEFESAAVPGAATTVQFMVKDSVKYKDSGGWGFGRFVNGQPVDEKQHQTCLGCHQARVKDHDLVFTRWAP